MSYGDRMSELIVHTNSHCPVCCLASESQSRAGPHKSISIFGKTSVLKF